MLMSKLVEICSKMFRAPFEQFSILFFRCCVYMSWILIVLMYMCCCFFLHHHNNIGPGSATDQPCCLSIQKALAEKLANAIRNYHKQTNMSDLNLANSNANLIIYLLYLHKLIKKMLKVVSICSRNEVLINKSIFFPTTFQSYDITITWLVTCNVGPTLLWWCSNNYNTWISDVPLEIVKQRLQ